MNPKVSIIVPNYNYAPYLKLRIDSILKQTYQDFELILLDDASTDESQSILRNYEENPHVSHIEINQANTGSPFQQWFKGIGMARGQYIWIAESDDLSEATFLATAVKALEEHPQAAFCFVGSTLIDEYGQELSFDPDHWKKDKRFRKQPWACFSGKAYAAHNLYWRSYVANASSALFRKKYFEMAHPAECLKMHYSGDWFFWFKLAMQGDVVEIYQKLNFFRQHNRKVTKRAENNGEGKLEDISIILQMEQALPQISRYKRIIRHGFLYSQIRKLPVSTEKKRMLYKTLKERSGTNILTYYIERINRILRFVCPFIITMKRDRLMPGKS